jgi:hypothetical protein
MLKNILKNNNYYNLKKQQTRSRVFYPCTLWAVAVELDYSFS